jgi:hypothetical protein
MLQLQLKFALKNFNDPVFTSFAALEKTKGLL